MAALRGVRVRYAAVAWRHLEEIFAFIARDNPSAARRVVSDVRDAVAHLKSAPMTGRPGANPGTREWVVRRRHYVIVYRIEEDGALLTVLGIYHAARSRP